VFQFIKNMTCHTQMATSMWSRKLLNSVIENPCSSVRRGYPLWQINAKDIRDESSLPLTTMHAVERQPSEEEWRALSQKFIDHSVSNVNGDKVHKVSFTTTDTLKTAFVDLDLYVVSLCLDFCSTIDERAQNDKILYVPVHNSAPLSQCYTFDWD